MPELRIVSEDLREAVQARCATARVSYLAATGGERFGRPANRRESKYLLTGLARCGSCEGSLIVRSRSHGLRRAYFYCCACYHERGRSICLNSLHLPLEVGDDAIFSEVERFVLYARVASRALALVLDELWPASSMVEGARARVEAELRGIELRTLSVDPFLGRQSGRSRRRIREVDGPFPKWSWASAKQSSGSDSRVRRSIVGCLRELP